MNNSRLTAQLSGKYLVGYSVQYVVNNVGHRSGRLLKNGASIVTNLMSVRAISGDDTIVSGQVILALAARDYVELQAYQTSGGNLNVRAGSEGTWFSILYVGE